MTCLEANTSSAKASSSGSSARPRQIVIPKEARELFGIKPGDTLLILGEAETGLIVSRPEVLNNLATELLNNVKKED